jgi:hypothetical protein
MVRTLEAEDGRDDKPIFIHSELDDYGLSAIEFRVYSRLARRSGQTAAFESVPNMAKEFEVSDRTVQRCLKVLTICRLIAEQIRPGKPTRYTLNPRSVWSPKSQLKATRASVWNKSGDTTTPSPHVTGDTTKGGGVTPQRGVVVTPQREEGSSIEGTKPNGGEPRAPRDPSSVTEVFTYWQSVMEKKGARLTPERERAVCARLKQDYTVDEIKQAVDGCRASPFHMGENDARKRYDDLTLICRNGAKLEDFMRMGEAKGSKEDRHAAKIAELDAMEQRAKERDDARRRKQQNGRAAAGASGADRAGAYYCPPFRTGRRET